MSGYSSKKAMAQAGDMMSDKGYEESTLEKQAEFAAKRNQSYYHYISEDTIRTVATQCIQELESKVKSLEARIKQLEDRDDYK